jgi:hypothetical protein
LLALLEWILTDGQKECAALAYTPLPKEVAAQQVEFVRTLMKADISGKVLNKP